jgi:peptidoglycan/xylan/chitin deacetylase (PgdA/CDA1 family)
MLWRLVRGRRVRGAAGDILNQVSYLVAVSLCLATIVLAGSHLTRHFHVVSGDPLAAFAERGPVDTSRLDPASKAESGLVPPQPVVPGPRIAVAQAPADITSQPLPTYYDLVKPVRKGTWLPILMYHYIRTVSRSDTLGYNLSITPEHFREQMHWLRDHGYTALTMQDVDEVLAGRRTAPQHPVALTFDDAYRDFYTTAAPILRESGFIATSYVPTQLVGRGNYMSWGEIVELDAEGFEMAAHSQFHVDISKTSTDRARVEVFGSKADLESHLGHQVVDWAYPYGGVNVAAAALVKEAGFWSGVTTQPGGWHDLDHVLVLSRVRMTGGDGVDAISWGVQAPPEVSPPSAH